MDAIALLKQDHRTVEELFKKYEGTGARAHKAKRKIVDRMIEELSVHAEVEEQVFYPAARTAVKAATGLVLESLEEHHIVKWTLSELEKMDAGDERFDAKVKVLVENVRLHVKEEERTLFPQVKKAMQGSQLRELGELMAETKAAAPTRPHPRSPDTPPGNVVAAPVAAIMDAAKEVAAGVVETAKEAVPGGASDNRRTGRSKGRSTAS